MAQQKSLSVYYSRKGNNYVNGSIVNLPVGNTEVIAKKIWLPTLHLVAVFSLVR